MKDRDQTLLEILAQDMGVAGVLGALTEYCDRSVDMVAEANEGNFHYSNENRKKRLDTALIPIVYNECIVILIRIYRSRTALSRPRRCHVDHLHEMRR